MPFPVVVDTNVGVVANLQSEASSECALACVQALRELTENGHLLMDDGDLIFSEYRRHLSMSGQPGMGDAFIRWVHDHLHNAERCTRVRITPDDASFREFPAGQALEQFDDDDRKFVAVAACHDDAEILVALDRGWLRFQTALAGVGIAVRHLCPGDIGGSRR